MRDKIKIFHKVCGDFEDLEAEVNEWMRGLSILEFISRHMSTSSGTDMHGVFYVTCTICIFYKGGDD
ncbi:MAG TPA: hypothetical protein VF817_01345 [Patescibacteria group bacterium]